MGKSKKIPPRPKDRAELQHWIDQHCGLWMPSRAVCAKHHSPLDYLCHAFFEDSGPTGDCVVWACRGGGKTQVGAVATLLDLLYKPGVQIRILGGSLEQSEKMYGYLRGLLDRRFAGQLARPPGRRKIELANGSRVEILAQSSRSVRGTRIQKLRCDEVEDFSRQVWDAAQLTTRSAGAPAPARAAVEAFSTMHAPEGLMSELVRRASSAGVPVFRWCAWDVIEKCARTCEGCGLYDGCGGRAHTHDGFLKIDDLLAMRRRVGKIVWDQEICCIEPRHADAVFVEFTPRLHVVRRPPESLPTLRRICGVDFGYAGAFAAVHLAVWRDGELLCAHVLDELIQKRVTLSGNVLALLEKFPLIDLVHADPAGRARNSHSAKTDVEVLQEAGLKVVTRGSGVEDGIELIGGMLLSADGKVRLTIDPRCTGLLRALVHYRRNAARRVRKDNVHDHVVDALRYALVGESRGGRGMEARGY